MAASSVESFCGGCDLKVKDIGYLCVTSKDKPENLYDFLIQHKVINSYHNCKKCGRVCKLNRKKGLFWCDKVDKELAQKLKKKPKSCKYVCSIFKGTFLSNVHLPLWKIMNFVYLYLSIARNHSDYIKTDLNISSRTYCHWASFVREVCVDWAVQHSCQIGGDGVMVQIEKVKFGPRKYSRGKIVGGQWVFGGVEQANKKNQFFVPVPSRDQGTLIGLIKKYIKPGSNIHSDCWWAYETLSEEDFKDLTVNHGVNFIDPVTGAQTQNIERLWYDLRSKLPGHRVKQFVGHMAEERFHQSYTFAGVKFHEFWKAAGILYPFDP